MLILQNRDKKQKVVFNLDTIIFFEDDKVIRKSKIKEIFKPKYLNDYVLTTDDGGTIYLKYEDGRNSTRMFEYYNNFAYIKTNTIRVAIFHFLSLNIPYYEGITGAISESIMEGTFEISAKETDLKLYSNL